MIHKNELVRFYLNNKISVPQISKLTCKSEGEINYWIKKYGIKKRTISDAIYIKHNPNGDPFKIPSFASNRRIFSDKIFLFGLGLGLYWGEGNKKSVNSVRLGNSDPALIKKFIDFLVKIYGIDKIKIRFQLQTYDDLNIDKLILFWKKYLAVKKSQFYKTVVLNRRGEGTYKEKMKSGVVIVYFNNMKLKKLISSQIANINSI